MLSMLQLTNPDGSKANLLLELNETELQNLIKTLQTVDEVTNHIEPSKRLHKVDCAHCVCRVCAR